MKKVAVLLAGSGVYDGSEIHESVFALLALDQRGIEYQCIAPNRDQHHVVNHLNGEEMAEQRNILVESARIARGEIMALDAIDVHDFDGLVIPGGFGAAKNLTDFAVNGAECSINTHVASACRAFAQARKPAGYLCIAPAIIPMIYDNGVKGTIGNDDATASAFNALGGEHITCEVDDIVFDEEHKVLSTPAYMLAGNVSQAASGIEKLVSKLVEIA